MMSVMLRVGTAAALVIGLAAAPDPRPIQAEGAPSVLPLHQRKAVMDGWVKLRLERILPEEMRRYGFDMWLVICNEGVEDPVFRSLVPTDPWAVRRLSMLVFYDRGAQGIERILIAHHDKEFYTKDWKEGSETQWQALARVVKARNPKRIGINQAVKVPFGDGLTAGLKQKLVDALGPDLAARLQSAEDLAVAMLERRLPEEIALYHQVVFLTRAIIREAFSSRATTPEVTTTDDLAWWVQERVVALGLERTSQGSMSILRAKSAGPMDNVIRRGDLVHCDEGLKYLGLLTDMHEWAYVPRLGETDVPAGLKEALRKGNRMQDILVGEFRVGRSGTEILAAALEKGRAEGLKPRVYTHPIGVHLHSAGTVIGLPDQQEQDPIRDRDVEGRRGDYPLRIDTTHAIELSINASVPEWGGQEVRFPVEQQAFFSASGVQFIGGRQTEIYVVR